MFVRYLSVRSGENEREISPLVTRERSSPDLDEHTRSLSFLPLAHVFERTSGHFTMFAAGATVAYAESADTTGADIELVRPTTATSVPRVYERIFDSMLEKAGDGPQNESSSGPSTWAGPTNAATIRAPPFVPGAPSPIDWSSSK